MITKSYIKVGWLVLWLKPRQRRHCPIGIGHAKRWAASHLWWRFYLVSVKPKDAHRQPRWVAFLRQHTSMKRRGLVRS